ncbi:hypothetical protein B0J18DRAFT_435635 [Chaetomium sp. MPI-SDFR-AT-0129]|nr:hypothetical protein B0J18DRAFT_435635 [Chaetomium sp. MPI-SDFR-AT-0129]
MYRVYALPLRQFAQRQSTTNAPRRLLHLAAINEGISPVTRSEFYALTGAPDDQLKAVLFRNQVSPTNDALPDTRGLPPSSTHIPALNHWFAFTKLDGTRACFTQHFRKHGQALAAYEIILDRTDIEGVLNANLKAFQTWLKNTSSQVPHHGLLAELLHHLLLEWESPATPGFARFHAPLALLDAARQYNTTQADPSRRVSKLYVAQMPLSNLPPDLQRGLPTPALLTETPSHTTTSSASASATTTPTPTTPPADIYTSSIWLGLEPTFTPWHRDPNDNIFCQLHGTKQVRVLPPVAGERLFRRVLNDRSHDEESSNFSGSSAIRGEEMMHSSERQAWYDAVWGQGVKGEGEQGLAPEYQLMQHAEVGPRDMMFIPKGWWHSFVSTSDVEGGLNASVNWWFRWRRPS